MSPWYQLVRIIREAPRDPEERLLRYIELRYGEHEADELRQFIRKNPLHHLPKHVATTFVDAEAETLAKKVATKYQPQQSAASSKPVRRQYPVGTVNRDKGSFSDEPIPQRPDRSGVRANVPPPTPGTLKLRPGEKPEQDPGTAGQHRPQPQPSQQLVPVGAVKRAAPGESGVKKHQRMVDYLTQTYGPEVGNAYARKYGVLPTADRLDAKGNARIHDIEKVAKMRDAGELPKPQKGESPKPKYPGKFHGQRWSPAGVSQKKMVWFANQATGNMGRMARFSNPTGKGAEWIWDKYGNDWLRPSAYAAKNAQLRAQGILPSNFDDNGHEDDFEDEEDTQRDVTPPQFTR